MSIRSRFIQLLVIWPDPTHWPTDPPNHPHTHPWVGVSLQIINLQTELNYLDSVNNFQIFSDLTWPHPSTHPPTKLYTHPWVGESPQISNLQTNWNISISSSAIEFWLILEVPPGGWGVGGWGGGVMGGCTPGWGWGWWEGAPHPYAHARACAHTYVWHHREFPGIPPMGAVICMKLSCLPHVRVRACTCMHVHACAHVWGVPPYNPPPPSTPHPHPQSHREPKTPKFNKSWTNQDNSILFEDSLPLNIPELIYTIADHPRHPPPTCPTPPELRKAKSEELQ